MKGSPYHTVHLQKGVFAASNPILTHYHAYFDKISSKHRMNSNKEPNHPHLLRRQQNHRRLHFRPDPAVDKTNLFFMPDPAAGTRSGAVTHLRRSFPAKPTGKHQKTQKPNLKIDSNPSKIDSNASKFILDSKLKPRGEG
jgi:hypothetical protein